MVLVKRICPPERRKAVIAVSVSLSHPTVSVNAPPDPEHPFQLRISLRIAQTTQPGRPITILTNHTVLHPSDPSGEYDTLSRGGAGLVSTTPNKRYISLGKFLFHTRLDRQPDDLKKRAFTHLITIPADGAVEIAHDFSVSRIFRHEQRLTKDDVVGESWRVGLGFAGYVGTTWWCWGDLEGDLKRKRLHVWHEGCRRRSPEPDVDDTWVLGCDPTELIFEDETEDASFRFVE
ncbi:hypothetical protein GTA08_BOTSDO14346 [Botryosphaeria dothidea]|uniref:Uncharacterized protein n=1 Tax=Botryosphaeria dothidea TaxID=55169 RepID=A0A8H4IHL5_9PEZI|nr:hypothetical protein GTA08_BOTSDO14346 [Botryosphaeria dothidea]